MLAAFFTFAVAGGLIVLLPGPDTLVVLRTLLRHGRRQALFVVTGVLTGLSVWVTAAALGLSALLRASHDGYTALRVAGAVYLLWLGDQSLRRGSVAIALDNAPKRGGLLGRGYVAGLATDLLNPKVGVFFVTFLPGFIPRGSPMAGTSMLLGAVFVLETAAYFAVMLTVASRITGWMQNERIRRRLDRATGLVLVGFGLRLAIEP